MSISNEPKFEPSRYRKARPLYPPRVYADLVEILHEFSRSGASFLDLGCGAGQSTRSFAALGKLARGHAIDADPAMIVEAREFLDDLSLPIEYAVAPAEALPLADASVDLVLIASAIHWFRIPEAKREIERVLKPGGALFVYEYQFPKCRERADLNEFIRRKFNTEWKAPNQIPRGTLAEILAPFTHDTNQWRGPQETRPEWVEPLSAEAFLANLFSQSRYLHAESASGQPETYQRAIAQEIIPFFAKSTLTFDFKPRTFLFRKHAGF